MNLKLTIPKLKLTRGTAGAGLGLLLLLAAGGWFYEQFHAEPAAPWVLKRRISSYLKEQTGHREFSTQFPFPSKAEMRAAPPAPKADRAAEPAALNQKDFETLKKEYTDLKTVALRAQRDADQMEKSLAVLRQRLATAEKQAASPDPGTTNAPASPVDLGALRNQVASLEKELPARKKEAETREQAVEPALALLKSAKKSLPVAAPADEPMGNSTLAQAQAQFARDMRQKFEEATSYEMMYRFVGEQLWVGDRLLDSANPEHRKIGLRIIRQAGRDALYSAQNGWLASTIYMAYVLPHLELAEGRGGADTLITEAADIFRRSDNMGTLMTMYKHLLAKAPTPQRADWARVQIAQAHEQAGEYSDALHWLKQVKATNDYRWAVQRIPWIERRIARQR